MPDSTATLNGIEVRFATFRDRPGRERDDFARSVERLPARERVLLETCHRVELFSVGADGTVPANHRGSAAVRRVFEVVAGFDSAIVAEEQLLRQVRDAYASALASGASGPILNELLRRALRFGRLVRSQARPGTDRTLADPAVAWLLPRLSDGERVAVVGTGEMGRLLALGLAGGGHPVTVVSASADRGGRLGAALPGGGHAVSVGPLDETLVRSVAAIVLAVRGRSPALPGTLLSAGDRPWVVDLSTPPAVDIAAATLLAERLLDVDRLGELQSTAPVLDGRVETRLRARLDDEVAGFVAWLDARGAADALALLHREADAVRRRHLARLRRRATLDDGQLEAVEAASAAMLGELLHGPTLELRRGGADAETVRRLFGLDR